MVEIIALSEHNVSAWINLSKQNIFNKKVYEISNLDYSDFQYKIIYSLKTQDRKTLLLILK